MSSIINKLDYTLDTKELIKQAIINKGVEVSEEDTLREYANRIGEISSGGDTNSWVGTLAEYEAEKDNIPDGYFVGITDDENFSDVTVVEFITHSTGGYDASVDVTVYKIDSNYNKTIILEETVIFNTMGTPRIYANTIQLDYASTLALNWTVKALDGNPFYETGTVIKQWAYNTTSSCSVIAKLQNGGQDGVNENIIYSTSEIKIGKWINNKDVYRKVISDTTGAPTKTYAMPEDMEDLISVRMYVKGNGYWIYGIDASDTAYYPNTNEFAVAMPNVAYYNSPIYLILEYTKLNE